MSADWLDSVLKTRPVVDDGFAERVIALGRAQRRTLLMVRGLLTLLGAAVLVALVSGFLITAVERWQTFGLIVEPEVEEAWFHAQRGPFREAFLALDGRDALARRSGRDAAPVLDLVERELLDRSSARAQACAGERTRDRDRDVLASRCDTGFLDGLAAYDEWRWQREVQPGMRLDVVDIEFAGIARTHLRRAAAADLEAGDATGTRFAKAAADAVALGRLLLGHSYAGAMVLRVVAEESERAQGRTGGFVPPLSAKEASLASTVWMAAVGFGGGAASDEDVEFLRQGRSVLTCGLRSDAMALDLSMQELYADRATQARNQAWTAEGCAPRPSGVDSWMLFGDEPTTGARLLGGISELPGLRWVMARIVVHPRFLVELGKERG